MFQKRCSPLFVLLIHAASVNLTDPITVSNLRQHSKYFIQLVINIMLENAIFFKNISIIKTVFFLMLKSIWYIHINLYVYREHYRIFDINRYSYQHKRI